VRRLVFLLLPLLPVLAQDDEELPPGPLKDLMDGLKKGDKEIRLDLRQSELNAIEQWLVKDREGGNKELQEFLKELRPEARKKDAGLGVTTAYTDAITLARRHKVREVKDEYLMQRPEKGWVLLFELPRSGRWRYQFVEPASGVIYQYDRKGKLVRTISFHPYFKRSQYRYKKKTFDGSNVAMMAKATALAVANGLARIRKRSGVFKGRLNKHIRATSSFRIEGWLPKGAYVDTRAYFFRDKHYPDATLSVTVRTLVEGAPPDPEAEAVLGTIRN
jgi:hypothetical protein